MSIPNPNTVRRALIENKKPPDILATIDTVCGAGAQCPQVQSSPFAKQALTALQDAAKTAHTSVSAKMSLAVALMTAIKTMKIDLTALRVALGAYETAVNVVAAGDASVIHAAGCLSRAQKPVPLALGDVTGVKSDPGKHPTEAILRWPEVPGATGYAIEVNLTPHDPAGPWTELRSGSRRRRVVKGPGPGSQLLARVAAQAGDGTRSAWSTAILVTTL
jgi:hypothetical protein